MKITELTVKHHIEVFEQLVKEMGTGVDGFDRGVLYGYQRMLDVLKNVEGAIEEDKRKQEFPVEGCPF